MRQFGLCSYCRCLEPARARTSENFFTSLTITPADIALLQVIYGLLVGVFNGFAAGSVEVAEFRSKISTFSLYYVYLSIGLFVFTYAATVGFIGAESGLSELCGLHICLPSCVKI